MMKFPGQRYIHFTGPIRARIVPKRVLAMAIVVPARMIKNGIKTKAVHGHTGFHGMLYFRVDVSKPGGTVFALGARFGNEHRTAVALIHFLQNLMEGPVRRFVTVDRSVQIPPLIAVVVVYADDVNVGFFASELRVQAAGQHIPRFKHREAVSFGLPHIVRTPGIAGDMDDRLRRDQARFRQFAAERRTGGDGGAHKLLFKLRSTISHKRIQIRNIAAAPGDKRDFIHRRDERDCGHFAL
ncbi:MAG: hypothetical protein ABIU05_01855 [Nitrospirales bacterium]